MLCLTLMKCCRGSSIKTRIETFLITNHKHLKHLVAEVVPLKQGLKQLVHYKTSHIVIFVAEVVPLKQGLKHLETGNPSTSGVLLQR